MASLIEGVDAVVAGDDVIDEGVLRAGKESRLRAVIKWGVGTDSIDTAAAAQLGIPFPSLAPGQRIRGLPSSAPTRILVRPQSPFRGFAGKRVIPMFRQIGATEVLLIALVVLLLFGGTKIPSLMRGLGQGIREFRREVRGESDVAKDTKSDPSVKDKT